MIFNPNSQSVPAPVILPSEIRGNALTDGERSYQIQEIDGSKLAVVDHIPSKGYAAFKVVEQSDEDEEILCVDQSHAETPFFHVAWNEKGQFISIYDKKADRELLPAGEKGNVIMSYEDRPHNYDAWDINHYYTEKAWEVDDVTSVSVEEQGPVRACVRFERKYLESTVVQYVYFVRF